MNGRSQRCLSLVLILSFVAFASCGDGSGAGSTGINDTAEDLEPLRDIGMDSSESDTDEDADPVFVPTPDAACESDDECDDGDACTTDNCDVELGCVHVPIAPCCTADQCEIDNACFDNDEENPANSSEICLVVGATDDWSAQDEIECDDENLCTSRDTCVERERVGAALECSDGNSCADDVCDEDTGECSWPFNTAP